MSDNDQRQNLKKDTWIIIMAVAAVLSLIFTDFGESKVRVYDCGMAEWHPDIPTAVKEECRRIRYEEWQRQQEQTKSRSITT